MTDRLITLPRIFHSCLSLLHVLFVPLINVHVTPSFFVLIVDELIHHVLSDLVGLLQGSQSLFVVFLGLKG